MIGFSLSLSLHLLPLAATGAGDLFHDDDVVDAGDERERRAE